MHRKVCVLDMDSVVSGHSPVYTAFYTQGCSTSLFHKEKEVLIPTQFTLCTFFLLVMIIFYSADYSE